MRVIDCRVGLVVADSLPFSNTGTVDQARNLQKAGIDAVAGYLGAMTPDRLAGILDVGMGYIPVTFAGEYMDGAKDELQQLADLHIPAGATVFLDLEGQKAFQTAPALLVAQIDAWGKAIQAQGYTPGLYVGVPQPLTSDELYGMPNIQRYWRGQGSVRDRFNKLAEPTGCGWCMTQMYPSQTVAGISVDYNMVGKDYRGRVPTMVVK